MLTIWKRHFLATEGIFAVLTTTIFAIWFWHYGGKMHVFALLKDNRATFYGTVASIMGSLLGFVITSASIVLGFSASENLAVVRESTQYPMLWKTFSATIRALACATLVSLVCLLCDRDGAPVPWLAVALMLTLTLSALRVARTIWVIEQIIILVTKPVRRRALGNE